MKKRLASLGVLLVNSVFLAGAAHAQTFKGEPLRRTFSVQPGGLLRVDAHQGSVKVEGSAGDVVEIEVVRKVPVGTREEAEEILRGLKVDLEQRAEGIFVHSEFHGRKYVNLEYSIRVPQRYNVEVKTWGGNVSVSGVEGSVRAETAGGALSFSRIRGTVHGETSGGDIDAEEVTGDLYAHTSGGRVDVSGVRGRLDARTSGGVIDLADVTESVTAVTGGGDIHARISAQPRGDYSLETGGAQVTVYLARAVRMSVDAKTSGGCRVTADIPLAVRARADESSLRADLNGGGPKLSVVTSGADIRLRKL